MDYFEFKKRKKEKIVKLVLVNLYFRLQVLLKGIRISKLSVFSLILACFEVPFANFVEKLWKMGENSSLTMALHILL